MAVAITEDEDSVFINCPFTDDYKQLFHSIIFAVLSCGFRPRTAMEAGDAGDIRLEKIARLIAESAYSIHDLSAVELDDINQLPRFNMPFELGMVIGCKKIARARYARRPMLIMERTAYISQKCLSDIAGQDLRAHGGSVPRTINIVRGWLLQQSNRKNIPGHVRIQNAFNAFYEILPDLCNEAELEVDDIAYSDFVILAQQWLVQRNIENAT